jgi:lipid-A-disaccharide synthase
MIIAGEASGDMHGANLVREMLKIDPALNFYGIGGKQVAGRGSSNFLPTLPIWLLSV